MPGDPGAACSIELGFGLSRSQSRVQIRASVAVTSPILRPEAKVGFAWAWTDEKIVH